MVVDTSKHMNKILEINTQEGLARVQYGVVKDQLNAEIEPHGYFFAPELSTSNRATIGGMINTDAAGQGSCSYSKTREHVLALKTVLMEGSVFDTFTRFIETELVLDTIDLVRKLGFVPWTAPFVANGKPLHAHGFRKEFGRIAQSTSYTLNALAKTNISLVGIEPSMTLAYRSEYTKVVANAPNVLLVQEWLAAQ